MNCANSILCLNIIICTLRRPFPSIFQFSRRNTIPREYCDVGAEWRHIRGEIQKSSFSAPSALRHYRHIIRVPYSGKAGRKQDRKTTPVDRVIPSDSNATWLRLPVNCVGLPSAVRCFSKLSYVSWDRRVDRRESIGDKRASNFLRR